MNERSSLQPYYHTRPTEHLLEHNADELKFSLPQPVADLTYDVVAFPRAGCHLIGRGASQSVSQSKQWSPPSDPSRVFFCNHGARQFTKKGFVARRPGKVDEKAAETSG